MGSCQLAHSLPETSCMINCSSDGSSVFPLQEIRFRLGIREGLMMQILEVSISNYLELEAVCQDCQVKDIETLPYSLAWVELDT